MWWFFFFHVYMYHPSFRVYIIGVGNYFFLATEYQKSVQHLRKTGKQYKVMWQIGLNCWPLHLQSNTLPSRFRIFTLSLYLFQLLKNNILMCVLCSLMID